MTFIGIDPGTRNLGLAARGPELDESHHVLVKDFSSAMGAVRDWVDTYRKYRLSKKGWACVGVEDYAFFGMRKNYGPMKELIGAIRGLCLAHGLRCDVFQPREKERAKLRRPAGQEDHAYDARCIAWLAEQRFKKDKRKGSP